MKRLSQWLILVWIPCWVMAQPAMPGVLRPPVEAVAEETVEAQPPAPVEAEVAQLPEPVPQEEMVRPQLNGVNLDLVIQEIEQRTGKTVLKDPKVPDVQITFMPREPLPESEYLKALESLLGMNNIALVPFRDRFYKLVTADGVVQSGVDVELDPNRTLEVQDQRVSQLIELQHLDFSEVQGLITERLSASAKVQALERNNAFLITDSEVNILRVRKILDLLDRPVDVKERIKVYTLSHATAAEVKATLEGLIEQSRQNASSTTTRNPIRQTTVRTPRGVIRPETPSPQVSSADSPPPGLIRGQVQMVADERTNTLLIVSRPENDPFFEEMIAVLDKDVGSEVTVEVLKLSFAEAEEVANTLNELIGAATQGTDRPTVETQQPQNGERSGQSLREFINQRNANRADSPSESVNGIPTGIGEISESTRILADVRTNSLILMGRKNDLENLKTVIDRLDIMLAQVAIRAVIMEVNLNDNLSYGIDWLQRSLTVNDVTTVNGVKIREPVMSFGGGQRTLGDGTAFQDGAGVGRDADLVAGSLSYFTTLYDYNLDAILRLAEGNSDAKVIATAVIVTMDNEEGSIVVGERRAIPTTTATTIGGSVQSSYAFQNIGLEITVTPRITTEGVVTMEIAQSSENVGGTTVIDGNEVPNITTRQLDASVAIRTGGTLALGGLVREDQREVVTKVPILGSIPILGALFRSKSEDQVRTELLVLLSPEVLTTEEEAAAMTERLRGATEMQDTSWHRGWEHIDLNKDSEE